jgi:hypothetical protein
VLINLKWKLVCGVLLVACVIMEAMPVMASTSGTTEITGTVPLIIYDVSTTDISQDSATVFWRTNGAATSQVFYDTEFHENIADYAHYTPEDTTPVTEHNVQLIGLSPLTAYHYRAKSITMVNGTEFTAISEDYTFTTTDVPPLVPMSKFKIEYAKIEFKKKPNDDRAHVKGELRLDLINGDGVDISEPVTVTVGPVSETITMVERGWIDKRWQYIRPRGYYGVINYMTINWKNGEFEIRMDKADFSGVTNPVTISIQIGDDIGEETILMREKKYYWDYEARRWWGWWGWWWRWWWR